MWQSKEELTEVEEGCTVELVLAAGQRRSSVLS